MLCKFALNLVELQFINFTIHKSVFLEVDEVRTRLADVRSQDGVQVVDRGGCLLLVRRLLPFVDAVSAENSSLGPQQPMSQLAFSSVFSLMGPPNTAHTLVSFTIASSARVINDCPIVYAVNWPQTQWRQADERARSVTGTFAPIYASSVASCLTKGLADRRAAVLLSPVHGGKGADPLKEETIAKAVQPACALSGLG